MKTQITKSKTTTRKEVLTKLLDHLDSCYYPDLELLRDGIYYLLNKKEIDSNIIKYSKLKKAIVNNLTDDLLKEKYKVRADWAGGKLGGHCYVASEAFYHLAGGKKAGWVPQHLWVEFYDKKTSVSHWFLKNLDTDEIVDLTVDQFKYKAPDLDYSRAVGKGFLTSQPSKRCKKLMTRVKKELK